ncbi:helix-turn-helix transcriptional regulator [Desmospora activa]|uniref:Helix-turn-helix protein n=1 Tax=Desmospora activa DSM 45169 TaxID=1121389 RepID=A0A2T4Z8W9_9BACL|nr:helix-turn-helix transcriptional regulator [Desmospora activa]PTM58342.1 helix-turn-helix protein [Desmospora activa DSM 45169]
MTRDRLIQERLNRNLTQKEVAEMMSISEVFVRKIEKRKANPGRKTMLKFEKLYGVSERSLFPDLFHVNIDTKCIGQLKPTGTERS